jgi:hypothetical protein
MRAVTVLSKSELACHIYSFLPQIQRFKAFHKYKKEEKVATLHWWTEYTIDPYAHPKILSNHGILTVPPNCVCSHKIRVCWIGCLSEIGGPL